MRKTRPVAPRPYHHGDLRRALLDEALALIRERGHLDFTLREIARRAGVSHGAPYRHFPDRAALVTALATEGLDELGARLRAALAAAGDDFEARFLAAGRAYVRFALEHAALFSAMFADEMREPDAALAEAKQRTFGLLLDYVREAQRAGLFAPGDPMGIATSVFAMHHGLAVLAGKGAFERLGKKAIARVVDDGHARLFRGLVAEAKAARIAR